MKRILGIGLLVLVPAISWACACGCGVFDVKTYSLFPTEEEGLVFLEYNYMDQNRNWSGASRASAADNSDKEIRTEFYTFGSQYMFNRQWGVMAEVPYENRSFTTTTDNGDIAKFTHSGFGDVRIKGIYAGFSPDLSSGITFGLKLPTGDYTYPNFDRDTEIGTGSTDALLGGYLMGRLPIADQWNWFVNGQLDQPFLSRDEYRPGSEFDAVAGIYYNGWRVKNFKIAPVAQVIGSHRWRDSGAAADAVDTGYDRVLFAPGIELDMAGVSLYADVAFPAYQRVNGNQLVAPELFTLRMSYNF